MLHWSEFLSSTMPDTLQHSPLPVTVGGCHCPAVSFRHVILTPGLPLLYVGGLTVPLGFARNEDIRNNQTYDYGYERVLVIACFVQ